MKQTPRIYLDLKFIRVVEFNGYNYKGYVIEKRVGADWVAITGPYDYLSNARSAARRVHAAFIQP